jgi:aminoglycoside phosphotransferase family enzyme/predicted kinase
MAGTGHPEILETHAAVLFFVGDRVFKLKKPVDLGFLDFRRRADREAVCHREVELNRRLAPDVYLGVADVRGPDGELCDHLVVMRRMPAERRLSTLTRSGTPVLAEMRRLARLMATFHAGARRGPAISAEGTCDALWNRWNDTFTQLRRFRGGVLDADVADCVQRLTRDFVYGRRRLFDSRVAAGSIVDGHADLLADDIFCLDDGPRVLDCIDFDDRLRYVDILDDVAFLAMDLEHLGAAEAAREFLDRYAEFSGDHAPAALREHFLGYRAYVRAKVACLRHDQGDPAASADVASYAHLALRHLRAGVVRLILVGGTPATGKTTLAGRLADQLGAVVLSSDRIRKELAGLDPDRSAATDYHHGIYSAEWTRRTYGEILHRARGLLEMGETVVLDASWTDAAFRRQARDLADGTRSAVVELRCGAAPDTVAARLTQRATGHSGASDADRTIAAELAADMDGWPQADAIATDDADCVGRALALVRAVETPPCPVS